MKTHHEVIATPESFESVMDRFKNLESWLKDESHESPEFHHYLMELQNAINAVKTRECILSENDDLGDGLMEEVLSKHLSWAVRSYYDVAIYAAMEEYAELRVAQEKKAAELYASKCKALEPENTDFTIEDMEEAFETGSNWRCGDINEDRYGWNNTSPAFKGWIKWYNEQKQ